MLSVSLYGLNLEYAFEVYASFDSKYD
jgi:hypothetical protein